MFAAFAALALLASQGDQETMGWHIPAMAVLNDDPEDEAIPNEMGKAATLTDKFLWAQLRIEMDTALVFDLAARGCDPQIIDYRQDVTLPRRQSVESEIEAIRAQAEEMFDVLERRCGLAADAGDIFMSGFDPVYRDLYSRHRVASRKGR